MKKLLLIFYSIIVQLYVPAQSTVSFLVLNIHGAGFYTRDKFRIPLKIGTCLSPNDEITLMPKSNISMVCNGSGVFPAEAGATAVHIALKNLIDSCLRSQKGNGSQGLDYLMVHLKKEEEESPKNNISLQEFGAPVRGCPDPGFAALPDTIGLWEIAIVIKYSPLDSAASYLLQIFGSPTAKSAIISLPWKQGRFIIDSKIMDALNYSDYFYTISKNGIEYCSRKCLIRKNHFVSGPSSMIAEKDPDFARLAPDEQFFVQGFLCEKNHLVAEALNYYLKAAKRNPKNQLANRQIQELEKFLEPGQRQ